MGGVDAPKTALRPSEAASVKACDTEETVKSPVVNRVVSIVATPHLTLEHFFRSSYCFSVVTEVDLSDNAMSPDLFVSVVEQILSGMCRLTTLDLKGNRIGPLGAKHLFDTLRTRCPRLRYLDVSDNDLGDEAMVAVSQFLSESNLETLSLVGNHISCSGAAELCKGIEENTSLTELALGYNELSDAGTVELAEVVVQHAALTLLDLSNNQIGDPGAIFLAHELLSSSKSHLKNLNLSFNDIGDQGLEAISEALCVATGIVRLDLSCNQLISDAGRREFTKSASKWRSIECLNLTSSNLDEQDGVSLARAIKTSKCSLREVVVLENTMLPPNAIHAIQEATDRKGLPQRERYQQLERDTTLYAGVGLSFLIATGVAMSVWKRRCSI